MSLGKARKIISLLLSVLIVTGGILFSGAEIIKYTLCNKNYMSITFSSKSVYNECVDNFKNRIEVISAKSSIPSRVFEAVLENNIPSSNTAVLRLFAGDDSTLYSGNLVEVFENLCIEYLKGNNISYDKNIIHSTAVYAAEVFSDCFGIKNAGSAIAFADKVNRSYSKYASVGMLFIIFSVAMMLIIFSQKSDLKRALYSAFTALGLSLALIGISGLIFNVGCSPMLSPQLYANALSVSVKGAFALSAVLGVIITALSFFGSFKQYKLSQKKYE